MRARSAILAAVAAVALLAAVPVSRAYEHELNSWQLRQAYFLGKDTTFRLEEFLKGYVKELPVPEKGVHVARVAIATPFKVMVDRSRQASDGYSPMKAEDQYREQPPPITVEVTLYLTPSYAAHTPYTIPSFDPITFRDADFWQAFAIHLKQRGDVPPVAHYGRPLFACDSWGSCYLTGAVVTVVFDPDQVASRPARVRVTGPEGQQLEVEFDLSKLR